MAQFSLLNAQLAESSAAFNLTMKKIPLLDSKNNEIVVKLEKLNELKSI